MGCVIHTGSARWDYIPLHPFRNLLIVSGIFQLIMYPIHLFGNLLSLYIPFHVFPNLSVVADAIFLRSKAV